MSRSASRKKRARHDIIMEILKLAKKGIKKTDLLFKARLSWDMLKKYLNALKEADFITEESGIWKTTEKGFHVIEACEICHCLTKEVP